MTSSLVNRGFYERKLSQSIELQFSEEDMEQFYLNKNWGENLEALTL